MVPVEGAPRVVYRVVTTDDRDSPDLIESFKSSEELGVPPRQGSPEARFNLIHRGISCFRTRRQAEKVAQRWGLGSHVAEVHLAPDEGISLAEWGSRGHVTVWSTPVKLRDMTVDDRRYRTGAVVDFMIFDSAGNAVESFDSDRAAAAALIEMASADPSAAQHLAILAFDADGEAVGDPLTVADLRPEFATTLILSGNCWVENPRSLTILERHPRHAVVPWRIAGAV